MRVTTNYIENTDRLTDEEIIMFNRYIAILNMLDIDDVEIKKDTEGIRQWSLSKHMISVPSGRECIQGEVYFTSDVPNEVDSVRCQLRVGQFLQNYGYEVNGDNVDSFFLLHEVGHIVLSRILLENGLFWKADIITDVTQEEYRTAKCSNPNWYMPTIIDFHEPWCDNFAMTNFKPALDVFEQLRTQGVKI